MNEFYNSYVRVYNVKSTLEKLHQRSANIALRRSLTECFLNTPMFPFSIIFPDDRKPAVCRDLLLCAVYCLSVNLLILVITNPTIGLNKIDQKTDFPYPISRFSPMYFATK